MSMDINAPLFRQLERLENIDSGHLTADVIKLKHQLGATATIPKGLL